MALIVPRTYDNGIITLSRPAERTIRAPRSCPTSREQINRRRPVYVMPPGG